MVFVSIKMSSDVSGTWFCMFCIKFNLLQNSELLMWVVLASQITAKMQRKSPTIVTWLLLFRYFLVACAPGRVTIQEDPPGHLSVAWSNVELGDYYVAFVKSDDGLEVHCNTSLTQCHFLSECGFTYFISVFAYNKAGQSPLGDVFNYTTGESQLMPGKGFLRSADSAAGWTTSLHTGSPSGSHSRIRHSY